MIAPIASSRRPIVILAAWLAASSLALGAEAAGPRPNIVYLLADQWRAQALGYAGDPNVKTPHLDRLAGEGLNFVNAVSVCPVCTPYRAALMTGRYPTSTGMFLNDAALPDGELCMAEIFKQAGYATAYIGKWHLDGHGRNSFIPPQRRQGWDYWKAAECDHNYNHSHYYTASSDEKRFWQGYDAFAQTSDAQQYLRERAGSGKPFLLMVSYGVPHFPHATAPDGYKALYPPESIRLPPNVPAAMEVKARQEAQGYYAHCTALDRCVGDLVATLKETRLADNTIVVFTSDHGEMLGSHDCPPTMKQVPWAEAANVPFLLRWPAALGSTGRVVRTPLTTPDILPTLLGLAGLEIPATVEGDNLSGLIRQGRDDARRAALYMGVAPFNRPAFSQPYRAIRTDRYTYVRGLEGPWLLFDNQADPYQLDNMASKPASAAVQGDLDRRLSETLAKIGDPFHPGPWYVQQWGYQVGPHGSVPYTLNAKPPSPRRKE
ncbi:MAG: sulfatase family protein [Thermoguttaceae bacterium]